MVSNVTSLTNNGLRDWLLQRISAVILAVYTLFLICWMVLHPGLDFSQWQALFQNELMRIASALVLINVLIHAWIGIWTVTTDYLKCTYGRLTIQALVFIGLVSMVIWGLAILWG